MVNTQPATPTCFLATQKLDRWEEARDPLPPKPAATSGLSMMHSQTTRNLFSLCKLKGNDSFATWVATIGNDKARKDSSVKPEGEGEIRSSAGKEVEASSWPGKTDQSIEYIVCFAKAVELYQKKNRNFIGCVSPDHLIWDCLKNLSQSAQKGDLNMKEETAKKGGHPPQKPVADQQARQGLYAPVSRRVMVVGAEVLGASLGEAATGADLGGSTDLAKHENKVDDDEPFKERFQRIPPPMVNEVHAHMKEMLEEGAIHPSQSPWCNAIVLVHKKDRGL